MHNNSVYEVDVPDRKMEKLTANIIAENMITQVDSK